MRKVLDLGELHKQLRQTEEHEPHFDEELMWNSYMESISWKIRAGKGGAIE